MSQLQKSIVVCFLFICSVFVAPVSVLAVESITPVYQKQISGKTTEQQIEALLKTIQELERQVAMLRAKQAVSPGDPSTALVKKTDIKLDKTAPAQACFMLQRHLSARSGQNTDGGDGAVMNLQQFLKNHGYMTEEPTGFFGPATEAAVKKFQAQKGIVREGTPETTGYGAVGPSTRAMIHTILCGKPLDNRTMPSEKRIPVIEPSTASSTQLGDPTSFIEPVSDPRMIDYRSVWTYASSVLSELELALSALLIAI